MRAKEWRVMTRVTTIMHAPCLTCVMFAGPIGMVRLLCVSDPCDNKWLWFYGKELAKRITMRFDVFRGHTRL